MKLYFLILLAFYELGCETNDTYWETSKFKINNHALEIDEKVKLLYICPGNSDNQDEKYYSHLIVVSQKTGDTVNILSNYIKEIDKEYKDKEYILFSQDNLALELLLLSMDSTDNNLKEEFKNNPIKPITKVARDPKFDDITDNNYPTVIGNIGKEIPVYEKK